MLLTKLFFSIFLSQVMYGGTENEYCEEFF